MTFLIGVGKSFLEPYYKAFEFGTPDMNSLCVLLVASVVLLSLVNKLPPMMASIIGAGGQSSGIGSFGAGAALGAATMAASAAASAGGAALAAANEVVGGASALNAAFKSAQAHIDSGSSDSGYLKSRSGEDERPATMPGQSAFGRAMGTASNNQDSGYASRLAHAGKAVASAGSIIAGHIGQGVSDRASAAIADTAGGRLETKIDESSRQSKVETGPAFEGDNVSAQSDEISDFVNQKPPQD